MLPLMEETLVEKRNWLSRRRFVDAVALAEVVPGPVTLKVTACVGYILRSWRGTVVAVSCFTLPSFLLITLASFLYFQKGFKLNPEKIALLLNPLVGALLFTTAWNLGKSRLMHWRDWLICSLAFVALILNFSPLLFLWCLGCYSAAAYTLRRLRRGKSPITAN